MADITMCNGKGCTMTETCYRFKATKGYYQSYFTESPINKETKECKYYWHICKNIKREGESCTLNNKCTYPKCNKLK